MNRRSSPLSFTEQLHSVCLCISHETLFQRNIQQLKPFFFVFSFSFSLSHVQCSMLPRGKFSGCVINFIVTLLFTVRVYFCNETHEMLEKRVIFLLFCSLSLYLTLFSFVHHENRLVAKITSDCIYIWDELEGTALFFSLYAAQQTQSG